MGGCSSGTCERRNKTRKDEFCSVAFRRKACQSIDEAQLGLDECLRHYNRERAYSGKYCYGKTPMRMFAGSIPLTREKLFGRNESDGQGA